MSHPFQISTRARLLVLVFTIPVLLAGLAAYVQAQEGGAHDTRLIETAPCAACKATREWMTEIEINQLIQRSHQAGHCGGFMDVTDFQNKIELPASAPALLDRMLAPGFITEGTLPDLKFGSVVQPLLAQLSAKQLLATVTHLSSYKTRYYKSETGVASMNWLADKFKEYGASRNDVEVELVKHKGYPQPSVIARIKGAGPRVKEVVVLGGHGDSINTSWGGIFSANSRAPGADDDASGTATVLEAFRVLAQSGYRPDRTIEFMIYAAEEKGLLGSQDIAQQYRRDGKSVAGVLQLDMTGYPSAKRLPTLITDHTNPQMTDFIAAIIEGYVKVPYARSTCGYGCSDHASWNQAGYPSAFPAESTLKDSNPKIHTADDTIENGLDFEYGLHFAKMAVGFAVELSASDRALLGADWPLN